LAAVTAALPLLTLTSQRRLFSSAPFTKTPSSTVTTWRPPWPAEPPTLNQTAQRPVVAS
jgi:hypothetical protein